MSAVTNPYSWTFFILSLLLTALLTPLVIRLAVWLGALDAGGYRREDRGPIPLLGGLAVVLPFALVCIFLTLDGAIVLDRQPRYFLAMAQACTAMALLGVIDDIYGLRFNHKLVVQILIALFLCWHGNAIPRLVLPVYGTVEIGGVTSTIITVIWLVALTNAFNLIDGVDGLAAGLGLVSALGFAALAAVMDNTFVVLLSLTLAGSLAGFLYFNMSPARIFLGDTGSMFIGFTLAGIGLLGGHRTQATLLVGTPLLILGLPIIETLISMARRFVYGRPVFFGDSRHTHHRLIGRGFSQRQIVAILCTVGGILSVAGVTNQLAEPGTRLAWIPYILYGSVLLAIAIFAGYAISPRKLLGSFARRGRNVLLNSLSSYGSEALSLNQGHQYLNDILHMFRRHAGLSFVDVFFEDSAERLGSSGVANGPAPVERLRVTQSNGRTLQIQFQFDEVPGDDVREDVTAAFAKMFEQARLRAGSGKIQEKSNILGIGCNLTDYQKVLETIDAWRRDRGSKSRYIVATNPHCVMMGKRNRNVRRAMAGAALSLPDGIGMVWAANVLGYSHRGRVTGPTLLLNLCDSGRAYGFRHFFYGGAPGVAEKMIGKLRVEFPGIEIVGSVVPPFRTLTAEEDAALVETINASGADIVWVGLGTAKQDRWMADHAHTVNAPVMIGVGAAFDFHSGNIKWAPRWIRSLGLEWAFRLIQEPRRLWRRNLDSPLFLLYVLLQKLKPPAFREVDTPHEETTGLASWPDTEQDDDTKNILVLGTGHRSELFLREPECLSADRGSPRRIVGILSQGRTLPADPHLNGHRILGTMEDLPTLLQEGRIHEVLVTESLTPSALQQLVATCQAHGVRATKWHVGATLLTAPEPSTDAEQNTPVPLGRNPADA